MKDFLTLPTFPDDKNLGISPMHFFASWHLQICIIAIVHGGCDTGRDGGEALEVEGVVVVVVDRRRAHFCLPR